MLDRAAFDLELDIRHGNPANSTPLQLLSLPHLLASGESQRPVLGRALAAKAWFENAGRGLFDQRKAQLILSNMCPCSAFLNGHSRMFMGNQGYPSTLWLPDWSSSPWRPCGEQGGQAEPWGPSRSWTWVSLWCLLVTHWMGRWFKWLLHLPGLIFGSQLFPNPILTVNLKQFHRLKLIFIPNAVMYEWGYSISIIKLNVLVNLQCVCDWRC